jgi:precorrin-6B methylase 1
VVVCESHEVETVLPVIGGYNHRILPPIRKIGMDMQIAPIGPSAVQILMERVNGQAQQLPVIGIHDDKLIFLLP